MTADLWAGLNGASGQPVGEIMDTWILQRGFPQLEVVPTGNGIKISQRRYLTIPDESDQTLWQVPVQTRQLGNSDATEKFLLKDAETDPRLRIGQWSDRQRRRSRLLSGQVRGRAVLGSSREARRRSTTSSASC